MVSQHTSHSKVTASVLLSLHMPRAHLFNIISIGISAPDSVLIHYIIQTSDAQTLHYFADVAVSELHMYVNLTVQITIKYLIK